MNLPEPVIVTSILTTWIPVVAIFLRGRARRLMTWATVLTAATVSLHLYVQLRLLLDRPSSPSDPWVLALVASVVPVLLAGYVLSLSFGRDHPARSVRASLRTLASLLVVGIVFLALIRHKDFITGYLGNDGRGSLRLGPIGKAYLSYVLIGLVLIGYNFERTYRIASTEARYHLRSPLIGLMVLSSFLMFILATGMLYSAIGMGKLVALALPIAFASLLIAYGYLRGAITDVAAPVSRNVVYSSFTALAAGLFVLSFAVASQIAVLTKWTPDEVLIITVVFLAVLVGVLLLFSNRFQRRVRRFIDRNFYVNRYDYRTQWAAVTEALQRVGNRDAVVARASAFLKEVFLADAVTIAVRDEVSREIRPVIGKGAGEHPVLLESDSPLVQQFCLERRSLLLDWKPTDFTYIPIYAENREWLDATASRIVSPLFDGDTLIGTVGLDRNRRDDPFTYEDVSLLDSISTHITAALHSVQLARELAETREMELMSQWSSMLLHDLKNYLAPLRMVAGNLIENKDNPQVAVVCAQDIQRVTDRMEKMVHTLSELRRHPALGMEAVCPNQLVREVISDLRVKGRPSIELDLQLEADLDVSGDRVMLHRVLENLVTNALEAMPSGGTLAIRTEDQRANGDSRVHIRVTDTGVGMEEGFLRDKLFRPFSTTKKKGLGLGLYQCRSIVRAHGGELRVESRIGEGTSFLIALGALAPQPKHEADPSLLGAGA